MAVSEIVVPAGHELVGMEIIPTSSAIWYAVVHKKTGELNSVGTVLSDEINPAIEVMKVDGPQGERLWDTKKRTFVERTFKDPYLAALAETGIKLSDKQISELRAALDKNLFGGV